MTRHSTVFSRDKHGRLLIELTGLGLTGQEMLVRMESRGIHPTPRLRKFLTHPDYDEKHRLEPGKTYTVALLFGHEDIPVDVKRTTAKLRKHGEYDYGKSSDMRAELALLLEEALSEEHLERWGIWFIAVLHGSILIDGNPSILVLSRYSETCPIIVCFNYDDEIWSDEGAFAFPVSQK